MTVSATEGGGEREGGREGGGGREVRGRKGEKKRREEGREREERYNHVRNKLKLKIVHRSVVCKNKGWLGNRKFYTENHRLVW